MHLSESISEIAPSLIASVGHSGAQAPQAMHSSEILYAMFRSSVSKFRKYYNTACEYVNTAGCKISITPPFVAKSRERTGLPSLLFALGCVTTPALAGCAFRARTVCAAASAPVIVAALSFRCATLARLLPCLHLGLLRRPCCCCGRGWFWRGGCPSACVVVAAGLAGAAGFVWLPGLLLRVCRHRAVLRGCPIRTRRAFSLPAPAALVMLRWILSSLHPHYVTELAAELKRSTLRA